MATKFDCGGSTYYEAICCDGRTLLTGDISITIETGSGPFEFGNTFNSDYTLNICGVTVPITRTTRSWQHTMESTLGRPSGGVRGIWSDPDIVPVLCGTMGADSYSCGVHENCSVEKSTLHYLDQRYGVLLYRYVKETLRFDVEVTSNTDSAVHDSFAVFKGPYGREVFYKALLDGEKINADGLEEWHFVKDGVDTVVSSTTYKKPVLDGKQISGAPCPGGARFGEILIFPAPGIYSNPQDCDVKNFAWYKNGQPAGLVNYFYPDWCKNLQQDPIWLEAEKAREAAVFDHIPIPTTTTYNPPALTVDPVPVGSFARHPALGDVYQWLLNTQDGTQKVITSPDTIATTIDKSLPEDGKTHDTTLIYPVSLV